MFTGPDELVLLLFRLLAACSDAFFADPGVDAVAGGTGLDGVLNFRLIPITVGIESAEAIFVFSIFNFFKK